MTAIGQLRRGLAATGLVMLSACAAGPRGALPLGTPFEREERIAERTLANAVEEQLGIPALGPVRIERVFRWRPGPGADLLVWVACRGAGDTRACAVAVGRETSGAGVRVLAVNPAGWSPPLVGATSDRAQLVLSGDDGRGPWRALLVWEVDHPRWSRQQYADGL